MKITIPKENLVYAAAAVERAVSVKNTLPILAGVKLCAADGSVRFSATDLDMAMECSVLAQVDDAGETVVNGRRLAALVRLLPDGDVTLAVNDTRLVLSYNGGEQQLPVMAADEFPLLPQPEGDLRGSIPVRALRRLVRQVGIAAATDEVRPVFAGIYTELTTENITMVATDTHRLAKGSAAWQGDIKADDDSKAQGVLLIPNRTLQEIARLATNDDDCINLVAGRNQAWFSFANLCVTTRMIMDRYPDYHQVIPEEKMFCSELAVGRTKLIEVLERASLIARESGRAKGCTVRLSMEDSTLSVAAEMPDEGAIHESISAVYHGDPLTINFNARYLLDALKAVDCDQIRLRFTGNSTPGVILPDSDDDYLYLLLPVRMNRPAGER